MKATTILAVVLAIYSYCTPANAQSFTSTHRLPDKAIKVYIEPYKSRIHSGDGIRIIWPKIGKAPIVFMFANKDDGPYLIIRQTDKKFEGFGRGCKMIDNVRNSKIEVATKDGFDPQKPHVMRWVDTKYEAENEDFEVEKMFKVADELYFLLFVPKMAGEEARIKLTFNEREILDSFAFPVRKHRTWKGV